MRTVIGIDLVRNVRSVAKQQPETKPANRPFSKWWAGEGPPLRYVGTCAVHSAPARLDFRDPGYRQWQRCLRCHRDISATLLGQPHYKDRLEKITRRQKIGRYGVVRLEIGGTVSSTVYIIRAEFHQQTLRPMMSLVLPNFAHVSVSL